MNEPTSPHGRGNTQGSRQDRVEALPSGARRRIVSKWKSFPEQAPVLMGDGGVDVAIGGVGCGKSAIAAHKMLAFALRNPRQRDGSPSVGCVLGSDFKLVRAVQLEMILEAARRLNVPYNAIVKRVVGGQDPRIEFWNGVVIHGFSGADPDRMRGHAFSFVWIDEAEYQTEQSFAMGLQRQRAAKPIRLIVTSSPDGAGNGWLWRVISGQYKEWDELRRAMPVRVHRWASRANKALDADTLKGIGAGLEAVSPGASRQELDGLFIGTDEAPGTGPLDWRKAFVGRVPATVQSLRASVVGVDLAKSEDFCWFTAANDKGAVVGMDRFNLSTVDCSEDAYWALVRRRLIMFASEHGADYVVVDVARGGDVFTGALREDLARLGLRIRVKDYATDTPGAKTDLCEALGMAIPLGRFYVPSVHELDAVNGKSVDHVETLRLEFKKLLVVVLPGGKRRFTHPKGGHDDGVVSCGLAWHGLSNRPPPQRTDYRGFQPPEIPGTRFAGMRR